MEKRSKGRSLVVVFRCFSVQLCLVPLCSHKQNHSAAQHTVKHRQTQPQAFCLSVLVAPFVARVLLVLLAPPSFFLLVALAPAIHSRALRSRTARTSGCATRCTAIASSCAATRSWTTASSLASTTYHVRAMDCERKRRVAGLYLCASVRACVCVMERHAIRFSCAPPPLFIVWQRLQGIVREYHRTSLPTS